MRSVWDPVTLSGQLPEWGPRARVMCFERIESTNDEALKLLEAGEPEGTLILAEEQTRGRGRRGRAWHSPAGLGIYMSLVLRPSLPSGHAPLVSLGLAVAIADALRRAGCAGICLKWPNDVLAGDGKIGGILAEARGDPGRTGLVVGLGLNVNQTEADFPEALRKTSTSLRRLTGRRWERAGLLADLLSEFQEVYTTLQRYGPAGMLARFEALMSFGRGSPLRVDAGKEITHGRFAGLGNAGELLLDTGEGTPVSCRYGEVHCTRVS